jgi:hypothetical protein
MGSELCVVQRDHLADGWAQEGVRLRVVLVRLVAPLVPDSQRRPEPLMVGVVDRVGLANEPDARTRVLRAPRLRVAGKFVLVLELDGGARIDFFLLGRR